jgi:hypothetical protein
LWANKKASHLYRKDYNNQEFDLNREEVQERERVQLRLLRIKGEFISVAITEIVTGSFSLCPCSKKQR